jgi:DNA polymerase-3 subunit beta
MKLSMERAHLLKSLNHVHRVVERRNTIPILSNILLKADGGDLKLKATDLDLEALEAVPAVVEEPGSTTVPAHMLYDIVRKLPDGSEVVIEGSTDKGITVRAGRSRFQLQCLPESDFPDLTAGTFSHTFTMKAGALKHLIERTQFAISTEETRYYLNGIYLHTTEANGNVHLVTVATDGHRLAKTEMQAPEGADGMPGIIIPRKAVGEIFKLLDQPDEEVKVELSDAKIRLSFGSVVLTSKLIDGTFPDYGRVIPQNNDKTMEVDRAAFSSAVDRVSTVASERGRAVKLSLSNGNLVLSVNNPDSGSATEELSVNYEGDDLDIGFNSRYLLDIAGQLESDVANFRLADSGSPTLIQESEHSDTLYVLMPMRV